MKRYFMPAFGRAQSPKELRFTGVDHWEYDPTTGEVVAFKPGCDPVVLGALLPSLEYEAVVMETIIEYVP